MKKLTHARLGDELTSPLTSYAMPSYLKTLLIAFALSTYSMIGTAESVLNLSPSTADACALYIGADQVTNSLGVVQGDFGAFAYVGSPSKFFFNIQDPSSEVVYLAFSQPTSSRGLESDFLNDVRFRIVDPSGNPITCWGPNSQSGTAGAGWQNLDAAANLSTGSTGYAQVQGGGYTPYLFDIAALTCGNGLSGDYFIEFYQDNYDSTKGFYIENFEVTVYNNAAPVLGRIWSNNWAIGIKDDGGEEFGRSFNGAFYVCDNDHYVTKVDFNSGDPTVGFRAGTFNVFFNSSGPENSGSLFGDRPSVAFEILTDPNTRYEYKVFLEEPDISICPEPVPGNFEILNPLLSRCNEYCFNLSTDSNGLIEVLIDLDGDGEYDENTGERFIGDEIDDTNLVANPEDPNFPYEICIPWDGRDGEGNLISTNSLNIKVFFRQGIFHFPVHDVEFNDLGYNVTAVRPACGTSCNLNLYYNDTDIAADNSLGPKLELNGCASPCHAWSDNGLPNFGNRNTVNTWWYAISSTEVATVDVSIDFLECTLDGITEICPGESTTLSLACLNSPSGILPGVDPTYNWEGPDGGLGDGASAINIDTPGLYSVTVTDEVNECEYILTQQITATPPDNCCTFDVSGPSTDGGTYECKDDIPAGDSGIFTINTTCFSNVSFTYDEVLDSGSGCAGDPQTLTRVWLVIDDDGNPVTADINRVFSQTFTIEDTTLPVIASCPASNVLLSCEQSLDPEMNPLLGVLEASDNCVDLDGLIISFDDVENLFGCSYNKVVTRTWLVEDACGNSATCQQSFQVADMVQHMVTGPQSIVLDCGESIPTPYATFGEFEAVGGSASDNCSTMFNITLTGPDQQVQGAETACELDDVYQRVYYVLDECNQGVPFFQNISYQGSIEVPALSGVPNDMTIECSFDLPPVAIVTATAGVCNSPVDVAFEENMVSTSICASGVEYTRTWTATDACGDEVSESQKITICPEDCIVLPVELGRFTANSNDCAVELFWETKSEYNTAFFVVEKSKNARDFEAIAEVNAIGFSTSGFDYQYNDKNQINTEMNYYRLAIYDFDGKVAYSEMIAVQSNCKKDRLFPNPATNLINYEMNIGSNENVEFIVLDVSGSVVLKYYENIISDSNTFPIKINNLHQGVYILQVVVGNSVRSSNKFLKTN